MKDKKKLGVISLGCDKNRVDSERLLADIFSDYEITNEMEQAQIIVINSCAFLESSRAEAINMVFECNEFRKVGKLEKIILTGCLPQKFIDDIFDDLVEVDGFLGTFDYNLFNQTVEECYKGKRVNNVHNGKEINSTKRVITTPLHYAYLKIADGCNNKCTYCLIPSIRGAYKSVDMQTLIEEAKSLGDLSELILVAQDTTKYGIDLYGKIMLVDLIQELSKLENIQSIRLLYCYPELIDDRLINELKTNEKLVKYLDIPLQHADDKILKLMNRKGTFQSYISLIEKLKSQVEGIAIRSTFIAGFPFEEQEQFDNLLNFISQAKLFNAGFFPYSKEEGTPAYKLGGQVAQRVKNSRVKKLYATQKAISKQNLANYKGKVIKVLCDGIDYDRQCFIGRAYFQAPEIDGVVRFNSDMQVEQGSFYDVLITSAYNYDLFGRTV